MTISKEKIEITTASAVIALIIGIGTIFGIFYNAKADTENKIDGVSERTAKLEAVVPLIQANVAKISSDTESVPDLVRLVKHAYPNY